MKIKKILVLLLPFLLVSQAVLAITPAEVLPKLSVPANFKVTVYAQGLTTARQMALGDNGIVYVGSLSAGKVYAIRDTNNDGYAETKYTIATGLTKPTGIAYRNGNLYVLAVSKLLRYSGITSRLSAPPTPTTRNIFPVQGRHGAKILHFGPDGQLYTSIGVECNICVPGANQGTVVRFNPDNSSSQPQVIANGVRNSMGMDHHPLTNSLYFTDNGRDYLGNDAPPEEFNHLSKVGQHFGFPYCHAGRILDPSYGSGKSCSSYRSPALTFKAHYAPLGMAFYRGSKFPAAFKNQALVALHGSWNRSVPHGYKVSRVSFSNGLPVSETRLVEGWLQPGGAVIGRPVDVLELPDGSVLISDDYLGAIYRVRYVG